MFTFFDFSNVDSQWYWVLLVVVGWIGLLVLSAVIVSRVRGESLKFSTSDLTHGGVAVAISFTLNIVGVLHKMPNGGSITLFSVVPILIYCYYFGYAKGLLISIVFMLLQFVDGPYVVHPLSPLFDYLIPYCALAFSGLFSYKPTSKVQNNLKSHMRLFVGAFIYFIVRYVSHVIGGVLFWQEWQLWNEFGAITYSMLYNITYCLGDFLIALIGLGALCMSRQFNSYMLSQSVINKRANALN